jgi:membrane associated rhomboid family serine protease
MIPVRDTAPRRRLPIVNTVLIAACVAASFLLTPPWSRELEAIYREYGVIPARVAALLGRGALLDPTLYLPFATATFLHGSLLLHLAPNMIFLWVFGDNVEGRLGHVGYLLFFLIGGAAASACHVVANPTSVLPTVGASGAIAAVMGAYFILYPRAWIISRIVFVPWVPLPVPALVYLALWFGLQLMSATSVDDVSPVAWWAHTGGFGFGVLAVLALGRRPAPAR